MGKLYKVKGSSTTKPTNLPSGFTVTEEQTPGATSLYGTTLTATEYTTFDREQFVKIKIDDGKPLGTEGRINTDKLFTYDEARNLANEILAVTDKTTNQRRVILDKADYRTNPTTSWRWYETDNGKFTYQYDKPNPGQKGDMSYARIADKYGIHSVSYY